MPTDTDRVVVRREYRETDPSTWPVQQIVKKLGVTKGAARLLSDPTSVGIRGTAELFNVSEQYIRRRKVERAEAVTAYQEWKQAGDPTVQGPIDPDVDPTVIPADVDGLWPLGQLRFWGWQTGRLTRDFQPVRLRSTGAPKWRKDYQSPDNSYLRAVRAREREAGGN